MGTSEETREIVQSYVTSACVRSALWLVLIVLLSSPREARADDSLSGPAPQVEPRTWYGWQILAADTMAIGVLSIDVASRSQGPSNAVGIPCLTVFIAAGPIAHAYHGRWGGVAASAALRILLPLLGTFSGGSQQGDWSNNGAAKGLIAGMAVASLLDVALAWQPLFQDHDRPAARRVVVIPVVTSNPLGSAVGLGGVF
jgi:hypothetical protein